MVHEHVKAMVKILFERGNYLLDEFFFFLFLIQQFSISIFKRMKIVVEDSILIFIVVQLIGSIDSLCVLHIHKV